MGRAIRIAIAASLVGLGVASGAHAASFDCAKAGSPREKLVCRTPSLSKLDDQLAEAYRATLTRLPEEPAASLKTQQKAWLTYLGKACPPKDVVFKDCVERVYNERLEDFGRVGVKKGPYLFTEVDVYVARATNPVEGYASTVHGHAHYPQIVSPATPQTRTWNAEVAAEFKGYAVSGEDEDGGCDNDRSYDVRFATAKVIDLLWDDFEYCHGAAHGMDSAHHDIRVMAPAVRPLASADLFKPSSPWKDRLTKLFLDREKTEAAKNKDPLPPPAVEEVAEFVGDLTNWQLASEGLTFSPRSYEFNRGYIPLPEVTILWADLKDVMSPSAPVP